MSAIPHPRLPLAVWEGARRWGRAIAAAAAVMGGPRVLGADKLVLMHPEGASHPPPPHAPCFHLSSGSERQSFCRNQIGRRTRCIEAEPEEVRAGRGGSMWVIFSFRHICFDLIMQDRMCKKKAVDGRRWRESEYEQHVGSSFTLAGEGRLRNSKDSSLLLLLLLLKLQNGV